MGDRRYPVQLSLPFSSLHSIALFQQTLVRLPRHLKSEMNVIKALLSGILGEVHYQRILQLEPQQGYSHSLILCIFRFEGIDYEHRIHRFTDLNGLLARSYLVITRVF